MPTSTLLADNIAYLQQAVTLLDHIDDASYRRTQPPQYTSSIGAHLRHCLEHYGSFLDGLPQRRIDYDARARDRRIEQDRGYAQGLVASIVERLSALPPEDAPLRVKMDSSPAADAAQALWSTSSVKRELQYLIAHTIHHYALVALIMRLQGLEPGADFGVAPSTLKYRRQLGTAA